MTEFLCHYQKVGKRQVHFRSGGEGPPLLILHQSPQSSSAIIPLAQTLIDDYCVVAPDSPGFGLSTPLEEEEPGIEEFADALAEFTEAISLPKATVVGTHTGAEIAFEFAHRYPDKVNLLLLDGFPLFTEEESEDILAHYLTPFLPRWDGGRLTWLWARLREQVIFFPWYKRELSARMEYDMPDAAYIHSWFMDFMYAGDAYRAGYGAAFRYRNSKAIEHVKVPTYCLYRQSDPLEEHAQRLPSLPDHVQVEETPADYESMRARIITHIRTANRNTTKWRYIEKPIEWNNDISPAYININGQQLSLSVCGQENSNALLLLHDTGRSLRSLQTVQQLLSAHYRVINVDLPGHGESCGFSAEQCTVENSAAILNTLLEKFALKSCELIAIGGSCAIASELLTSSEIISAALLHNILLPGNEIRGELQDKFPVPISPDEYGVFISKLWYAIRDNRLFWPWFAPIKANIRRDEPDLSPEDIHAEVFDALRCAEKYARLWKQSFSYDFRTKIEKVNQSLMFSINDKSPWAENTRKLAKEQSIETVSAFSPEEIATTAREFFEKN